MTNEQKIVRMAIIELIKSYTFMLLLFTSMGVLLTWFGYDVFIEDRNPEFLMIAILADLLFIFLICIGEYPSLKENIIRLINKDFGA